MAQTLTYSSKLKLLIMKIKLLILACGFIGLTTLSSCKKDWACKCSLNGNYSTTYTIQDKTLLDARSECKSHEASGGGNTITCSID